MRVADWLRDGALRKVAKHGVPVAAGKVVTAFSGLITLAILARHLGPGPLGVLALIRTVVTVVDQYANFNTWQAIIKYGTEAIAQERREDVERVIKLAIVIDAVTAILGALVVVGMAFIFPGAFGWTTHESTLCALYAITLVSKLSGTSDGIYRICDAYRVQAIIASVAAIVVTAQVGVFVALGAGFDGCVFALILGEVATNVTVTVAALWVAKQKGYGGWRRKPLRGIRSTFPGIVRFLAATNAQLTLKTTSSELDMIVVGSMLGKAPAGLFRVMKQLGTIPGRIFLPFEQVLFTELARSSASQDFTGFRRLLRRTVAISSVGSFVVWAVAALAARPLIELVAGPDFAAAAEPFRWYLLAMVIHVTATPILRAMIALGRPGTLFLFDVATLVILIVAAIIGARYWGLVGIACALIIQKTMQLVWSSTFVFRFLRRAEPGGQLPSSTMNT